MPKGIYNHKPLTEEHKKKIKENHAPMTLEHKNNIRMALTLWKKNNPEKLSQVAINNLPKNCKGSANGNWKGGLIERFCNVCNKQFYVKRKVIKNGWGKFCSKQCGGVFLVSKVKKTDTDIELIFETGLKSLNINYKKQVALLGVTVADFVIGNKVVYCDGDYWHRKPEVVKRDKRINQKLKDNSYEVYRFWGEEIKNSLQECISCLT